MAMMVVIVAMIVVIAAMIEEVLGEIDLTVCSDGWMVGRRSLFMVQEKMVVVSARPFLGLPPETALCGVHGANQPQHSTPESHSAWRPV